MTRLTVKQQRFCDYYIITGNATESAIKAGYSKRTAKEIGFENLTKPHLKEYIDERMKQLESERVATADEVLQYLTRVMRGEENEKIIKIIDDEEVTIELPPDIKERTKAAELLGKKHAIFTDKKEVDINIDKSLEDFFGDD